MNLAELAAYMAAKESRTPKKACQTCTNESLNPEVWTEIRDGRLVYVRMTEDGRIVPLDT